MCINFVYLSNFIVFCNSCPVNMNNDYFKLNCCSLKRKSTSMAKRQSFMLEEKPLSKRTLKTVQSKLPSKCCPVHIKVLENCS